MNPFTKGRKVRAVRDTKSYGVGTPIPEGAVLEVARTNEVDAASLFNAIRPDGGEYALAKDDFEPVDATPALLDPSKVRAGDTVTLLVDPPDTHPAFTVAGEAHSLGGPTVYLGGWRVDDLPDYVTLTDHQPAPEPEPDWKPGTVAIVTPSMWGGIVNRALRGTDGGWYTEAGGHWDDDEVSDVHQLVVIDPAAVDWRGLQSQMSVLVVGAEPFKRAGDILAVVRRELGIEATS